VVGGGGVADRFPRGRCCCCSSCLARKLQGDWTKERGRASTAAAAAAAAGGQKSLDVGRCFCRR
jgi:hypothetical protein